jgi:hypothetical protein
MGQILGLGITHYPGLAFKGDIARRINMLLADPALPERLRTPAGWPAPMREQWSDDEGAAHSARHRQDMIDQMRWARQELDAFQPDFVVIWGDDQFENFRDDCVPAFAVLAYDEVQIQPWQHSDGGRGTNWWDEPADTTLTVKGHRPGAKAIATSLLLQWFDIAYAYRPLHGPGLGHAHVNSVLYLDFDRQGFPHPIVPFSVNAYGRHLVRAKGRPQTPSEMLALEPELDPPGTQPWRCVQLGAAVARAVADSPWRVALVASSSWSHSFLVPKHSLMYPDVESDRRMYEALMAGDWDVWRNVTIDEAEDRGHQELLNWFCLAGAMAELDRKPQYAVFLESWITNSDKVFAAFRP